MLEKIEKREINNAFLDLVSLVVSTMLGFFRSLKLLMTGASIKRENRFFLFLDFIFRRWPTYFWKKPTAYKLFNFIPDLIAYTFKTPTEEFSGTEKNTKH